MTFQTGEIFEITEVETEYREKRYVIKIELPKSPPFRLGKCKIIQD